MMALLRNKRSGRYVVLIFLADDHAALFFGAGRTILACASIGSSWPARTAPIALGPFFPALRRDGLRPAGGHGHTPHEKADATSASASFSPDLATLRLNPKVESRQASFRLSLFFRGVNGGLVEISGSTGPNNRPLASDSVFRWCCCIDTDFSHVSGLLFVCRFSLGRLFLP